MAATEGGSWARFGGSTLLFSLALLLILLSKCARAEAAVVSSHWPSVAQLHTSVTRADTPSRNTSSVTRSDSASPKTRSVKGSKASVGEAKMWPSVRVLTPGGLSDFGWVGTSGAGVYQATVYSRTCFNLTAFTRKGALFDEGPKQKAFFVAYLSSGPVSLAATVTYLSSYSAHSICYTAPTAETYLLDVRLVFVNADAIFKTAGGGIGRGFANYTRVLQSNVRVQGPVGYSLSGMRSSLPLCTRGLLTESQSMGYWVSNTWEPLTCRLQRMEPGDALLCLRGKRVLMLGNSQARIAFGILQAFLSSSSRESFTARFASRSKFLGDTIQVRVRKNLGSQYSTYNATGDRQPPKDSATGLAVATRIDFLKGVSGRFFGNVRNVFVFLRVRTTLDQGGSTTPLEVDFNITYSTLFSSRDPVFAPWMLEGRLTRGVLPIGNGDPLDVVFDANALHDVSNFGTSAEYARFLTSGFLPRIRPLLKESSSFTMYGGMSAVESRLKPSQMQPNNPRLVAFENAGLKALVKIGYQSVMKLQYVTSPRRDLASDPIHYGWPVSLTMIDMWLGPYCTKE